jgi:hypothetical protein
LEGGVVADNKSAEKPGSHYVVVEIGFAVLSGKSLGGAHAIDWNSAILLLGSIELDLQRGVDDRHVTDDPGRFIIETPWDHMLEAEGWGDLKCHKQLDNDPSEFKFHHVEGDTKNDLPESLKKSWLESILLSGCCFHHFFRLGFHLYIVEYSHLE